MRLGGLGLQSAVKLAPSAFLASSHSTADLVRDILPGVPSPLSSALLEDALAIWSSGHDCQPPEGAGAARQKSWDDVGAQALAQQLLEGASDRARLLASAAKESGSWLHALPISSLGSQDG